MLLSRTILKLNFDGKFEYFEQPNGQKRYFKDLMSNREEVLKECSMETLTGWYKCFRRLPIENLTYEEFLEIYGILDTNRTTIYSGDLLNTTAVGVGIYLVSFIFKQFTEYEKYDFRISRDIRRLHKVKKKF